MFNLTTGSRDQPTSTDVAQIQGTFPGRPNTVVPRQFHWCGLPREIETTNLYQNGDTFKAECMSSLQLKEYIFVVQGESSDSADVHPATIHRFIIKSTCAITKHSCIPAACLNIEPAKSWHFLSVCTQCSYIHRYIDYIVNSILHWIHLNKSA